MIVSNLRLMERKRRIIIWEKQSPFNLLELPGEIVEKILLEATAKSLFNLVRCSKYFYKYGDKVFWQLRCERNFIIPKSIVEKCDNYKTTFSDLSSLEDMRNKSIYKRKEKEIYFLKVKRDFFKNLLSNLSIRNICIRYYSIKTYYDCIFDNKKIKKDTRQSYHHDFIEQILISIDNIDTAEFYINELDDPYKTHIQEILFDKGTIFDIYSNNTENISNDTATCKVIYYFITNCPEKYINQDVSNLFLQLMTAINCPKGLQQLFSKYQYTEKLVRSCAEESISEQNYDSFEALLPKLRNFDFLYENSEPDIELIKIMHKIGLDIFTEACDGFSREIFEYIIDVANKCDIKSPNNFLLEYVNSIDTIEVKSITLFSNNIFDPDESEEPKEYYSDKDEENLNSETKQEIIKRIKKLVSYGADNFYDLLFSCHNQDLFYMLVDILPKIDFTEKQLVKCITESKLNLAKHIIPNIVMHDNAVT